MKKLVAVLILAAGLSAQPALAEVKIAFVNVPQVLEQAPQAEAARQKLQREFAPRDADLGASQKKLKSLQEKLTRDAAVMSQEERRKLERDIIAQERDFKRAKDEFADDLNLRRNEEFGKLQRDVASVVMDLAKEKGYDLILESGVVFASKQVDITDEVIGRLNKLFKAKK